uniref:Uncharacterized protein n=1 Tax=Rhodnius prolixus TaxID=13249 RepID=T1IFC7_RHOPR
MGGKRFSTDEEVKEEVEKWTKGLAGNYFEEGIKKLIPRFTTCIERNGSARFISYKVDDLLDNLYSVISVAASNSGMVKKVTNWQRKFKENVWFNYDCRAAKKQLKLCHRKLKKSNFGVNEVSSYIACRKAYRTLLKSSKLNYQLSLQSAIANIKNPKQFWSIVRNLSPKNRFGNIN